MLQQPSFGKDAISWPQNMDEHEVLFDYMNELDPPKKSIYYGSCWWRVLDLKLKFDKEFKQTSIVAFAKDTNSFSYVLPSTCFPNNNVENISKGAALRLRRVCDSYDTFEKRSTELFCC